MTRLDALLDQIEEGQKMEGQIQLSTNATSLEFLQAIYRDNRQPLQRRMRAAIAALPFERPKFAVVATTTAEDMADRLRLAIEATGKVINGRATLVETRPAQVAHTPIEPPPVEAPDHSMVIPPVSRNGFSKRRF